VQRAGVDQSGPADALVGAGVGVALEQVVVALLGEDPLLEPVVVAVGDGDPFAAELQVGEGVVAGDADRAGVAG